MTDTLEDELFRFHSITSSFCEFDSFDPKERFSGYHFYEIYDPNKEYDMNKFEFDFGKGIHTYEYELRKIYDENSNNIKQFVVANEILSKEEQTELAKYCCCSHCEANFFKKRFTCACCVGCLKSYFPQQHVINKTRENMNFPQPEESKSFLSYFFNY